MQKKGSVGTKTERGKKPMIQGLLTAKSEDASFNDSGPCPQNITGST
jgi:hypothetical protein